MHNSSAHTASESDEIDRQCSRTVQYGFSGKNMVGENQNTINIISMFVREVSWAFVYVY